MIRLINGIFQERILMMDFPTGLRELKFISTCLEILRSGLKEKVIKKESIERIQLFGRLWIF